jgi:hypothetical protein
MAFFMERAWVFGVYCDAILGTKAGMNQYLDLLRVTVTWKIIIFEKSMIE